MQKLYSKLKDYNLDDAIKTEQFDRQFLALKRLWKAGKIKRELFLSLVLTNSIICYQLSSTGENYWEEFSEYFLEEENIKEKTIIKVLILFIKQSKGNRRLINMKIKRLEKLKDFLEIFEGKQEYYYDNMLILRDDLTKVMKQKNNAKTIVFAVKMFYFGAKISFNRFVKIPKEISIPLDSRLNKLFKLYKGKYTDIDKFYTDLSKTLDIPQLHLDTILWVNYNKLCKNIS